MKKLLFIGGIALSLMMVVYFSLNHSPKIEMHLLKSITEIYEKEEMYVLFAQESCISCRMVKNAIQQNDSRLPKEIYVIDLDTHEEKDLVDIIVKKYNIEDTPALLKIKRERRFQVLIWHQFYLIKLISKTNRNRVSEDTLSFYTL